jgi:hypothetical protein
MTKRIQVHTNDPIKSMIPLVITGKVEKFATIKPQFVRLIGTAGAPLYAQVNIIPEANHPFKIVSTRAKKGDHIRFSLKDKPSQDPQGYLLTIENALGKKGRYFDKIYLKTTSAIHPELEISVYGNIKASDDQRSQDKQ